MANGKIRPWRTPSANRIEAEEEAESARLLYVAMTRARDYLLLSGQYNPPPASWFAALDSVYRLAETSADTLESAKDAPVWQGPDNPWAA